MSWSIVWGGGVYPQNAGILVFLVLNYKCETDTSLSVISCSKFGV